MILHGIAHVYGDDIDTDVILPGPYMNLLDQAELARHALEGIDPGFIGKVRKGDILVAGRNFGCGSSREHAPIALKGAGISCIIAKGFARIFFRNALNVGLPVITAPAAVDQIVDGQPVTVDLARGTILAGAKTFEAEQLPPFVRNLIAAGGLEHFVRERLAARTPQ